MRKIVSTNMDKQIILDKKVFYNIIIKNPTEYYHFISSLKSQIEKVENDIFTLSNNNKTIPLSNKTILITDMFTIEDLDRKMINSLYKYISKESTSDELTNIIQEFNIKLNSFIKTLSSYIDVSIDYNDDIDIKDLLKMIKAIPELSNDKLLDKLIDFIKFIIEVFNKDIIFICNLSSFFSKRELELFIKEMNFLEVNIINIESKEFENNIDKCSTIIIDEDLCEYYK